MVINFMQPYALLLLAPAIWIIVRWWRKQRRMIPSQRWLIGSLRMLLFLLLILAMAGTHLLFPVQAETVIFVVDRSASMNQDQRAISFLQESIKQKRAIDQYGIVSFGQTAAVEQPITTSPDMTALGVEVGPHATNLADGIRLASGLIPSMSRGKIVLLTDGLATHGDATQEIKLARERGIAFQAVSLQQPSGEEVVLSAMEVPDRLYAGEEFQLKVAVESTVSTKATIRLYEGNRELGSKQITVEQGSNQFLFPQSGVREGFHRYRVEISTVEDTIKVNNQAYAFTHVQGTPRVLIVEGHAHAAKNLVNALRAGTTQVDVMEPARLPKQMEDYRQYASIILADVDATQMGVHDMERIRSAVADFGVGLVMTGGSSGFGMGGWFKTPIEEALPVHMDLRGKEKLPSLGLVLVIDKSGSMSADPSGGNKMELAKEAAIRATEMLGDKDHVGVVAFDGEPWVVVPPQSVANLPHIHQQIGSIFPNGGTDIFPALQVAYDQIKSMQTQRKHVILLTDGQSGRDDDYQGLLQMMTGENITVSTVAVGDDADIGLLEEIAQAGKGRFYQATDPGTIPQIFSKETALASRAFIVEKPQVPMQTGAADWQSLSQGLPPIHAYVTTTAKQTAEKVLLTADQDPLLSRWQYGLGRSVAWTSDLEGKWSAHWVVWGGFSRFWNEVVSWTFPQISQGQWKTQIQVEGNKGIVTVTLPSAAATPQTMEAVVVNEQIHREAITLKPIAPGTLRGEFAAAEPGTYLLQVNEKIGEKITASQTAGLTISYSPEYGLRRNGDARLQEMILAGDGQLITEPALVFANDLPQKWESQPIADLLLLLAALLLPFDVAARRLPWPKQWGKRLKQEIHADKRIDEKASSPAASFFGDLTSKKEKRWEHLHKERSVQTIEPKTPERQAANRSRQPSAEVAQPKTTNAESGNGQAQIFNRLLDAKKRKS
ncbi:VWA domain-containing protein [Brevibacillus migulae]|uniref:VWA domain-containing protein n=1 Tax=Brevibacillus migulae TaxID=1644114 RepID=UPI00106DD829|nr:VWA domain-containing protein [Brevibacillus migulae]